MSLKAEQPLDKQKHCVNGQREWMPETFINYWCNGWSHSWIHVTHHGHTHSCSITWHCQRVQYFPRKGLNCSQREWIISNSSHKWLQILHINLMVTMGMNMSGEQIVQVHYWMYKSIFQAATKAWWMWMGFIGPCRRIKDLERNGKLESKWNWNPTELVLRLKRLKLACWLSWLVPAQDNGIK